MILIIGIIWSARQGVAIYWEQTKFLLNINTVRDGERLLFNNVPWRVTFAGMQCFLTNPSLKGGLIRLPLKSLIGKQSRPFHEDEPWFPSREGDYVLLDDSTWGKVTMQSPETVILEVKGGCRQTYPVSTFLQKNPVNLTINNFGVSIIFGIDYDHQPFITDEIPEKLKSVLEEALSLESFGDHLVSVMVQFKEADTSSLNLLIFVTFAGPAASSYYAIHRAVQRIAVEACNTNSWCIPFTQITLHSAQSRQ